MSPCQSRSNPGEGLVAKAFCIASDIYISPSYCTYKAYSKENTASRLHLRWISTDAVSSYLLEIEELKEFKFR
jgi:hypothetical protein